VQEEMMEHTRNLKVAGRGNGKRELPILRADGKEVGCIRGEGHLGDAHLFVAAADLLKTCEATLDHLDRIAQSRRKWTLADQNVFEALEAVITKAKGENTR